MHLPTNYYKVMPKLEASIGRLITSKPIIFVRFCVLAGL